MSGSEEESRTSAVGRKRNLPMDFYDHATITTDSGTKQPRLEDTTSVSSKESGEISDSDSETKRESLPSVSPNASTFERWQRRKVVIPLSGVVKKPTVLQPAGGESSRHDQYFDNASSSDSEESSETESSSEDSSIDNSEESDGEESDYEPLQSMASPRNAAKGTAEKGLPSPLTRRVRVRELSEREQDFQYQYFWDVEGDDLVYCLCCGERGHTRENCMERVCKHCNALEQHASIGCPTYRKCTHCRQRGHDAVDCTNVGKTFLGNDSCDVCSEPGHLEVECFLRCKSATKAEPEESTQKPESPPPARSWMMGMLDDSRD